MKTMIRWALLTAVFAVNAAAQEWTGFYAGAAADGVRHVKEWTDVTGNEWSGTITQSRTEVAGRLIVGANRQTGGTVLGLEADYTLGQFSESTSSNNLPPNGLRRDQLEGLITLRGRYGFAVDNVLLYGTAGLGMAKVTHGFTLDNDPSSPGTIPEFSETLAGLVYGLGIEHRFHSKVSFRLEYLGSLFGTESKRNNNGDPYEIADTISRLSLGLLYHF